MTVRVCVCARVFEKLADQTAYGDGRTVVQLPAEGGGGAGSRASTTSV